MIRKEDTIHLSNSDLHRILQESRSDEIILFSLEALQLSLGFGDEVSSIVLVIEHISSDCDRGSSLDVKCLAR